MEFKVGDLVKVVASLDRGGRSCDCVAHHIGKVVKITNLENYRPYDIYDDTILVKFLDGSPQEHFRPAELVNLCQKPEWEV